MNQLRQWFAMGGYSLYVWPAYGLVLAVLIINLLFIRQQAHKTKRQLKNWFKRHHHASKTQT
ncbi:MAG: heme exporter protein CcmD [Legionella sp.]